MSYSDRTKKAYSNQDQFLSGGLVCRAGHPNALDEDKIPSNNSPHLVGGHPQKSKTLTGQ